MMEKDIQVAIARADIVLTMASRVLFIAALTIILLVSVLAFRAALGYKTPMLDYDAPGVDITSEGPDNDIDVLEEGEHNADSDAHL